MFMKAFLPVYNLLNSKVKLFKCIDWFVIKAVFCITCTVHLNIVFMW